MLTWWFEVGAAILGVSIVLTLTMNQLVLGRQEHAPNGDRAGSPPELRARSLPRIPRDVFSILAIVVLAILVWIAFRQLALRGGTATPSPRARIVDTPTFSVRLPKLPVSAFSPLPKDYSINQPPWCPACRRHSAPQKGK